MLGQESEPSKARNNGNNATNSVQLSLDSATYYVCGPLLTLFIAIGLIGNSVCVYIFLRRRSSAGRRATRLVQPIYVYLLALALWDLILLITSFLLYNFHVIVDIMPSVPPIISHPVYLHSLPYIYYATITAHTCANWIVVALGLERYFALCHPFRHRLLDGRRRAIYVACSISLAGVLYSLPRLYETSVSTKNGEEPSISFNHFQQSVLYKTLYKVIGGMFLYSVGPFVCLFVVSIRVSTAVRQQRAFQAEKTRRSGPRAATMDERQKQNEMNGCSYSVNVMLIAVMVKLLFVHSLPTALDVAETTMGDHAFSNNDLVNHLVDASILLVVVNSTCNFFVYFVCSRQFRREIRLLLRRPCYCGFKKRCGERGGSNGSSDQWTVAIKVIDRRNSTTNEVYRKTSSYSDLLHKLSMRSSVSV